MKKFIAAKILVLFEKFILLKFDFYNMIKIKWNYSKTINIEG